MIRIRRMTEDDLPLAIRLKTDAGWNQVEADWRRFLEMEPEGCFVAQWHGDPVGTTVVCTFDTVAWIAMVLVQVTTRGQGIGTALVRHAVSFLDQRGVNTIRLDATPLGQPIYEKLGFASEYTLTRYSGVPTPTAVTSVANADDGPRVRPARPGDHDRLIAFDSEITGTHREKFLQRLFRDAPGEARLVEHSGIIQAYMTVRFGSEAIQLGPCLGSPAACKALLASAIGRHAGEKVYLDVPMHNTDARQFAESLGLTAQRTLVRMDRGPRIQEDVTRFWASSGPELG